MRPPLNIDPLPGECEARYHTVCEITNAIVTARESTELFHAISGQVRDTLPFDRYSITLLEPEKKVFRVYALEQDVPHDQAPLPLGAEIPLDKNTAHRFVLDHANPCYVPDFDVEVFFEDHKLIHQAGFKGAVHFPLMVRGECIGVFNLASRTPLNLSDRNLMFLGIVAQQIALAISNVRAFEEIRALRDRLRLENRYLREELRGEFNFEEIVGRAPAMQALLDTLKRVAATDANVMIYGETGSGKELVARAIHENSHRRERPLIRVNCAALSASLIESELFGHEQGAFTGAIQQRIGRFELADGGTLLLDEVGDVAPEVQAKLLRVLQEQEFERVGGVRTIKVDVRVIAATHRNLKKMVDDGSFREDLFYRLNVFPVTVPPLRDRPEDIETLAEYFVRRFAARLGKSIEGITPKTLDRLRRYPWPGNVRELAHLIERALILNAGPVFEIGDDLLPTASSLTDTPTRTLTLEEMERMHILRVLDATQGVIAGENGAAKLLDMHPNTLRSRMQKLGIRRT